MFVPVVLTVTNHSVAVVSKVIFLETLFVQNDKT